MIIKRQNLHNHTKFSDGRFSPREIIDSARAAKVDGIGISDHFFTSKVFHRMNFSSFLDSRWPVYREEMAKVKVNAPVDCKIWTGIEIDTCSQRLGADLAGLPWTEINTLDYVLLEYVGEMESGGMPPEDLERINDFCEIPVILAHSNIERIEQKFLLEDFLEILSRNKIALEIPGGTRNKCFWRGRDCTCLKKAYLTVGTDTHENLSDVGAIDRVLEFLKSVDLVDRLMDPDSLRRCRGGKNE